MKATWTRSAWAHRPKTGSSSDSAGNARQWIKHSADSPAAETSSGRGRGDSAPDLVELL